MRWQAALLVVATAAGCGGGSSGDRDPSPDAGDPGQPGDTPDAAPELPAWQRGLAPASQMEGPRGLTPLRGIVHLHSPYSHDACDGAPRAKDGALNEDCLQHLRDALCATRIDFAALSDHDDSMADEPWGEELFLVRDGDRVIEGEAGPVASAMACPDGHDVTVTVGSENDLMPLMLDRHPDGDAQARHDAYNASDPAAVASFRALGGLVWVAHSESRDPETLAALGLDGMEIWNLHAAIDPDIREESLGLDGAAAITRALEFADADPAGPEPDLAILAFMEPHVPSLQRWETLLGAGQRVVATAGTDAHENAVPIPFRDGERGDSYRRMLRWFSNVALVESVDAAAVEAALAAGRSFVAFEILGTPVGFDVRAEHAGGVVELGGEVTIADGATIVAVTPSVLGLDASLPPPEIRTAIVRVDAKGSEEIAVGNGEVTAPADQPGAYRVEVRIAAHHLGPYLGTLGTDYAEVERVWIYSNPIYVTP